MFKQPHSSSALDSEHVFSGFRCKLKAGLSKYVFNESHYVLRIRVFVSIDFAVEPQTGQTFGEGCLHFADEATSVRSSVCVAWAVFSIMTLASHVKSQRNLMRSVSTDISN